MIASLENPNGYFGRQEDGTVRHYPLAYEDIYAQSRAMIERGGDVAALAKHDADWGRFFERPIGQYRPLPVARMFHESQAQFRALRGGNRSSKSYALSREVFMYAAGLHPWRQVDVPNVTWYATVSHEMVGSVLWSHLKSLLIGYEEGRDYKVFWRNRGRSIPAQLDLYVFDANGQPQTSSIIFKSYEEGPRVFQGTARRLVAFDEQFDESIWLECVSRIGAEYPLDVAMALTPIYSQPWLEEKFQTEQSNWATFEMPIDDNRISRGGFIEDGAIDSLIEEWPEEIQPTRRLGQWGSFLGAVYKTFSRSVHVVGPEREAEFFPAGHPTPDMQVVGAIDWGGANPFVFLMGCKLPHMDNAWYIFAELYHSPTMGSRLLKDHAEAIQALCRKWKCGLTRVWADHDPTDARELAAHGVRSQPAKKDVNMGIECVQGLMKVHDYGHKKMPHLFVNLSCGNTIREISSYRWSTATKNRDPGDTPVKKDDHCADGIRYLCFSEEHAVPTGPRISLGASNRRSII